MASASKSWVILACLLPPVLLAATCGGKKAAPVAAQEPTVYLHKQDGSKVRVSVEVARTPEQRRTGLMHRTGLDKGSGMIFIFPEPAIQSFWMKNTLISLDMIFIGEDMKVVGVVENTVPMSLQPCRVDGPSRYVLEVEAGFAALHGIGPGTRVTFKGFEVDASG